MEKRPKDIIDQVEAIAADAGNFAALDDHYFETLVHLSEKDIERLVIAMLIDCESDIRRISKGGEDNVSIEKVTDFLHRGIKVIGHGLMMFGPFGTLQMCARVGGPSSELLEAKVKIAVQNMKSSIRRVVAHNLSWILLRPGA